jgi:hypothetical protein
MLRVRCCIDVILGDNMRRFILYLALCLCGAFAPHLNICNATANASETSSSLDEDRYQAYVEKIAQVERDTADLHLAKALPEVKSFQELAAAGSENIDLCIRFLAEGGHKGDALAIYSMHKLNVDDYVVFVRKLAELHHRGLLSDGQLLRGLDSRYSDLVFEHYQNPKIQALLDELAARNDVPPAITAEIKFIRSGEMFERKRRADFDRECTRWSEVRSISSCISLATQILRFYAISLRW